MHGLGGVERISVSRARMWSSVSGRVCKSVYVWSV